MCIYRLRDSQAVVQQYLDRPLLLYGLPFSVQAYVLVTSMAPLQAYMYADGLVQFRHDYQHKFQKVWFDFVDILLAINLSPLKLAKTA